MGILRQLLFGKYLLATNTISCGLMMTTGDLIQQSSEYWKCFSNKYFSSGIMAASIDKDEKMSSCEYDYTRMKNMTIIGLLQGPFHHWFYMTLDRVLPDKNARSIVKKIFLDQSIASPTCLGIFYVGLGILERDKIEKICQELKVKFMTTWKVDCCFWPPTQCINFIFVPLHYRVLYTNFMTVAYDIFLSYMKYDVTL